MDATTFLEHLAAARRGYRAGGPAVLDGLVAGTGLAPDALREQLLQQGGVQLGLPADAQPDFGRLDAKQAKALRCVVLKSATSGVSWAAEDPWDSELRRRMSALLGGAAVVTLVGREAMESWLASNPDERRERAPASLGAHAEGPVVAFVDAAIRAAVRQSASDVHFQCDRAGLTVKHRLDGVLSPFARLEGVVQAQEAVSRIKVLAQLDITERRLPQDGRFRFEGGAESVDLRVSIMPSVFGEDAVLRLLDKAQLRARSAAASLDALGFDDTSAQRIRDLASEPSGLLLVTGPTGSGKTTTLYAVLNEINTGQDKIITIEDPVEYQLPGVLQIPVNERKGLTFAKGLRSILRHDPDRILVGEIRDAETAEIAIQSSLTGHLVFTTVHANGLTDIMGRFRHFGLDMFALMSSLNGVVVQRLVRRLCPDCSDWREARERETVWLGSKGQTGLRVPVAVGCAACGMKGYRGRFVIAEVHTIDDEFRDQVTRDAPMSVLKQHADRAGVQSLGVQAAKQVAQGATTMEEVRRVVGWL